MTGFVVATANFGGGARAIAAASGAIGRAEALAAFIRAVSGRDAVDALPRVVALQEMTRLVRVNAPDGSVDYPQEIADKSSATSVYYAPAVGMTSHPLAEKWQARWDEDIQEMEQGMFACTNGAAELVSPWLASPRDRVYRGRVLDLTAGTFYRGSRDTEPRLATAHGVCLGGMPEAQFIFLNVHLATLKEEDARTIRIATPRGSAARERQLTVIAEFILEVAYGKLGLPVVVAGDFNATADAPEMSAFMQTASLRPVFSSKPDRCFACGLSNPVASTAPEYCRQCHAPFFSHKRNFQMIDNILYTPSAARAGLRWQLTSAPGPGAAGIRLDTDFSDHLPLWVRFSVTPS